MNRIKEYRKIKAHQTITKEEKSWQAKANDEADRFTNSGGSCTTTLRKQSKETSKDLTKIVDLLLGVFVMWPSHKKSARLPATERAKEKMKITTAGGHEWEKLNEAWRCKLCLATARSKRTMLTKAGEKCKAAGVQSFYDGLIGNGH